MMSGAWTRDVPYFIFESLCLYVFVYVFVYLHLSSWDTSARYELLSLPAVVTTGVVTTGVVTANVVTAGIAKNWADVSAGQHLSVSTWHW